MSAIDSLCSSGKDRYRSYQSYQSGIVSNGNAGNEDALVPTSHRGPACRRMNGPRVSTSMLQIGVVSLFVTASIIFLSNRMTEYERDLASMNDLSLSRASVRKIRKAQGFADAAQAKFLSNTNALDDILTDMILPGDKDSKKSHHSSKLSADEEMILLGDQDFKNSHLSSKLSAADEMILLGDQDSKKSHHKRSHHSSKRSAPEGTIFPDHDSKSKHSFNLSAPEEMVFHGHHQGSKKSHHSSNRSALEGCEATIVIVRHCEKGDEREHCQYDGYERSVFLATLFGNGNERWPAPSHIFALSPGGRHNKHKMNYREVETVASLSQKVGVPIDSSYNTKHTEPMVKKLLNWVHDGEMCGKVAIISWKHSSIGHLAHRLGCGPSQGCPLDYRGKTFDEVWQLKYVYRKFSFRKKKRHHKKKTVFRLQWKVFGSVQNQGFDPLAFSKIVGDYPKHGLEGMTQPGWHKVDIPERRSHRRRFKDKGNLLAIPQPE